MKIVVVGGGKMGLPLACLFADRGAQVTVCDTNPSIVQQINEGVDPHDEPEQQQYVHDGVIAGRLQASTATAAEVEQADAVIILVSALLTPDRDIDWRNLVNASADAAKGLRKGTLVSYETTIPVGSCRTTLVPILERSGLKAGRDFDVVFSPERVKSRLVFARLTDTPKIVGGITPASAAAGVAFYSRWLGAPVIDVGSLEAAEFAKLAGMAYRDLNIALANELAALSEDMGLDVWPLLRAANTDGETAILLPGIGVGGHCTPVYPYFLINGAARRGISQDLVALARKINERQPDRQIDRLEALLGSLRGQHIHILGLAFRPQVREDAFSPAIALQSRLVAAGARVTLEDPLYDQAELTAKGFTPGSVYGGDVDAVILHTAHPEFTSPNFSAWHEAGIRVVLDGRAAWSRASAEAAGLAYIGVGVGSAPTVVASDE